MSASIPLLLLSVFMARTGQLYVLPPPPSSGPGAYASDAAQPIGLLCDPCPPPHDF
jgi:hypothetical protein